MKTRARYYTMLWIYTKRRNAIRNKMGMRNPDYAKAVYNISNQIKVCQHAIKRIDKRNKKLSEIVKKVNEFYEVKIESTLINKRHTLARNCFYKYGIDNGIGGRIVSSYIRRPNRAAARARRTFTQSFKSKPENKEQYHKFLNYMRA